MNFYDSVTGADVQVPAKALAVWGDCGTREDFGNAGEFNAVPVYGARQPNQSLCIVLQQGGAESCLRVPPKAVSASQNQAGAPDFYYRLVGSELPTCVLNPQPWAVAFTHGNGQQLDVTSAEALIDGGQAQIGGSPVAGEKGNYTVPMRRETLDTLRTPDPTKSLEVVALNPDVFKRLGVDVNPLSRTITVRVEPQVVNLAGMSFEFWTAESNRKIGSTECNLELDVPDGRNDTDNVQRGGAWASLAGQKLQLTHAGEQRYRLRAGSATGDEMLRKLFVAASNGDFQKRAIKFRHQTRESERDCYLVDTTIKDTELLGSGGGGSRVIVRDVGQPTSGLIILATTDSRINQDPSLKEADYQFAVEQALVHLGAVPKYIMSATNKPFAFSKVMIGNVGMPPIDLGAQSGDPFSARGLDTITRLVNDGVLNRRPALQVNDARRTVEDVFKARGVAAGGRALPAAIIHVGDIVQKPGGENFCNSSTPNTLATSDWLPAERQFLKISFGSPETIAALVKANTLRELERAQRLSTYSCAYNVPGRVAEFVIAIPVGQTAAGSSEVRSLLLAEVQKLFSIKSQ